MERAGWVARSTEAWEDLAQGPPAVAFVAPPFDTIPSLAGNAIYVLVERLAALLPYKCVVLTRWPDAGQPADCSIARRILYFKNTLKPGFTSKWVPYRLRKFVWGVEAPHLLRYGAAAGKACKEMNIQLAVVEDEPFFCRRVRSALGRSAKVFLHQHSNAPRGIRGAHWPRIIKALDGIAFVATEALRLAEQRHGKFKIPSWVIYNGVQLNAFDPKLHVEAARRIRTQIGIPADAVVMLYVGRLVPQKGVVEAAEAFHLAGVPGAHMLVVGDLDIRWNRNEPYLERLKDVAANAKGSIHIAGKVIQKDLPAWYAAADAVIVPSIGWEGLPLVVTEALAMGRPVVASERGGTWELLTEGRNGWLLKNPADPVAVAAVIKEALSDRVQLEQMSKEILREDRPKMSEERMLGEFAAIVHSILSPSRVTGG
jgi:glycosyltransferase involved in cell wall biosynthesis